jgi:hypothetical protein
MPPVVLWIVGAVGAAAVVKWLAREGRRINAELDAARARASGDSTVRRDDLERDPQTGIYRPR